MKLLTVMHPKLNTKVYVMSSEIVFFFYAIANSSTEIVLKNGQVVHAVESPDDIIKQMEQ